ncbi:MAG: hypothetical protein Q9209_005171 [Squamulea sp. 1 TL-2023]
MQQVVRMTPMPGARISAIDFAAIGDRTKHCRLGSSQNHQQRADMSAFNGANIATGQDGTASGIETADDTKKTQSDDADSDEKSASVGDPDVLAPSDMTYHYGQIQTGLPTKTTHQKGTEKEEIIKASNSATKFTAPSNDAFISDEDDYNGVDLISESGDEDPTIESLEEKAIIDSEEDNIDCPGPLSPPNSPHDAFSFDSAELGQVNFDVDPFLTDDIFFTEQIHSLDPHPSTNDTDYCGSVNNLRFAPPTAETPRRRVHFAEPLMIPYEASTPLLTHLNTMETSSAQPGGDKSEKKHERTGSEQASRDSHIVTGGRPIHSTMSDNIRPVFEPSKTYEDDVNNQDENDDTGSSVGNSSGYETDQGETTDEEDVPASATARPLAVLRDSSNMMLNHCLDGQPLARAPPPKLPPRRRLGPTLGSWVTNPTKPIAVVASNGKQLKIYPAQRPASREGTVLSTIVKSGQSSLQASPRSAVAKMAPPSYPIATDDSELERNELSSQGMATPMLSGSPNLMMSGLGLSNGNQLRGHTMGPSEAFFPFQSIRADGTMVFDGLDVDYDDDDDDDGDDGEDLLNIEDFIDFGEDSEDSDQGLDSTAGSRQSPTVSSPTQGTAKLAAVASSPTQTSHLDHLDKGVLTAFRRDQHYRKSNAFGRSSRSPFRIADAVKENAFVALSTSSGPSNKRKLSGHHDISPGYDRQNITLRAMSYDDTIGPIDHDGVGAE